MALFTFALDGEGESFTLGPLVSPSSGPKVKDSPSPSRAMFTLLRGV